MQLGMIGLGKMGANMCRRLSAEGHQVVGFDLAAEARTAAEAAGVATVASLEELVGKLAARRIVWVMVPAGDPTDATIEALAGLLSSGDVVIDGGNSNYKTATTYGARLEGSGIGFLDAGTSGGIWGLENGYCLMVGGNEEVVSFVEPIFSALAQAGGYAHVGPIGAGHFVKMVHNGIEYGLMQAYAEGFELMGAATELHLDLHQIASLWRNGSVVRSWLLDLTELALAPGSGFEEIEGRVVDSGEGRWSVEEAVQRGVPLPVITLSLYRRFGSRQDAMTSFANRLLAALRNQFGGHGVHRSTAPSPSPVERLSREAGTAKSGKSSS